MTRYRTIVADPPWQYASAATKADARKHYSTMSLAAIADLDVPGLADTSCHLWLWTTNAFLEDAYWLVRSWRFRPLTVVTWCKRQPGVGYYLRNNTEHCVFATKGAPMVPEDKPISTWYEWPRGAHSAKPEAFYDLVEQVSPEPRLEMFSRRARLGWDTWGDEALGHVALEPKGRVEVTRWQDKERRFIEPLPAASLDLGTAATADGSECGRALGAEGATDAA